MITLHLSDLKALQAAKTWKHFYFLSENQPGYDEDAEPLKASLTFTGMDVSTYTPVAIYFMGMGNSLGMNSITAVDCEPHVLGDLLKISCKGGKQYIIVAQ